MTRIATRLAVVSTVLAAATVGGVLDASAAPSTSRGSYTEVTTPTRDTSLNISPTVTSSITVSGRTSLDITSVAIDCISYTGVGPKAIVYAPSVGVTNGQFSKKTTIPSASTPVPCRLVAIPSGIDPNTDYIGSFTGPVLRFQQLVIAANVFKVPVGYTALVEESAGAVLASDAGDCGGNVLVSVAPPQLLASSAILTCFFSLVADGGGLGSIRRTILVDKRSAFLPSGVATYLISNRGLKVAQSKDTIARSVAANGDTTITESATLVRCSHADTYPPTSTSCPSVVSTGVQFQRTLLVFRNGHQVRIRDAYVSTDHHAHSVALQYLVASENEINTSGAVGYVFPHRSSSFQPSNLGETLTGLGSGAGTVYARSDLRARSDDPNADTLADTWSRPPSKVQFATSQADLYQLAYAVSVPAGGRGVIGFAVSERPSTNDVKVLAGQAVNDMRPGLSISSPANGATFRTTKTSVRGSLTAGANGLPRTVTVNGHRASIRVTGSAATYSVAFAEKAGVHTVTVVATDAYGLATTKSIRVRNR